MWAPTGDGARQLRQSGPKRPRERVLDLPVDLEDLFNGAIKHVPLQRCRADGQGRMLACCDSLAVHVQPGMPDGVRITLPG
jgi:hypothetical protein